jgi:hypothetical protein
MTNYDFLFTTNFAVVVVCHCESRIVGSWQSRNSNVVRLSLCLSEATSVAQAPNPSMCRYIKDEHNPQFIGAYRPALTATAQQK